MSSCLGHPGHRACQLPPHAVYGQGVLRARAVYTTWTSYQAGRLNRRTAWCLSADMRHGFCSHLADSPACAQVTDDGKLTAAYWRKLQELGYVGGRLVGHWALGIGLGDVGD